MKEINLNSGESMFHSIITKPIDKEIVDTDLKRRKIKVNVPCEITGMHIGKINVGDILICGPFSNKYVSGRYEVISVEQRTHKGSKVKNAFFKAIVEEA